MKKLLWFLLPLTLLVGVSFGFVSCSDDDDDTGIVGTWSELDGDELITITFKSDGTGTITEKWHSGTFTYKMTDKRSGTMTVKEEGSYSGYSYYVYTFRIEGDTLYVYEEGDRYPEFIMTKQGKGKDSNNVLGTWIYEEGYNSFSLTFKSGGTGTAITKYYDSYSGMETEKTTFTYSMASSNSGTLTIRGYDSYSGYSNEVYTFKIQNNRLSLYYEEYFVCTFIKQ